MDTISPAILDAWPLELPDNTDDRRLLRLSLFHWRMAYRPRSLTLRLGDRYTGNEGTALMTRFLTKRAMPRLRQDVVEYPSPPQPLRPIRERPPAFSKGYSTICDLTAIPGCTGMNRNSQVYRGTLRSDIVNDGASAQVAVKLFETSRLPPDNYHFLSPDCAGRSSPTDNILQTFEYEIWAYKQLESLQGSLVPHVYGFFRVVLPHGEPCIALVLEYIDTISHKDFMADYGTRDNAVGIMGERLSSAMQAIHAYNVFHNDLAGRNVLLPVGDPMSPVLIDFADAQLLRAGFMSKLIRDIIRTLKDIGFDKAAAQRWAREKLDTDQAWAAYFDVPLEDEEHVHDYVLAYL